MEEQIFDYGIIGSGPAGHTAAFIAAKQGFSVILFEKDELGGVCLNRGCIPTKTILHSVELYNEVKKAENIGIETSDIKLNLSKIMERKEINLLDVIDRVQLQSLQDAFAKATASAPYAS